MATHQGAYTPPGGPLRNRIQPSAPIYGGGRISMHHGFPYILYGEDEGKIIVPGFFLHPRFGVLETVDAHWTGSAWKIALAKRAKKCPDCAGKKCGFCLGAGALDIPLGTTIQDYCARPVPQAANAVTERVCPVCQAKKCPTCKGKGEVIPPFVWMLHKHLKPRGRTTAIKPGNTNRPPDRSVIRRR